MVPRMYYHNFDKNVTLRYHIVVENWPLAKFVSPSDIGTSHELSTLFNAWQSNTTTFRKLEGAEWKKWEEGYYNQESQVSPRVEDVQDHQPAAPAPAPHQDNSAPLGDSTAGNQSSQSSSSSPILPSSSAQPSAIPNATATSTSIQQQTSGVNFVNTFAVIGENGRQVQVVSKPRKKRKDAGVRRGRRGQRRGSQNDEPEE